MTHEFPLFAKELEAHSAAGYHVRSGTLSAADAERQFARLGVSPAAPYRRFLEQFGPGEYFGGSLVFFSLLGSARSVESWSPRITDNVRTELFAIAYDGTTAGCFCLDRRGNDPRVFWHRWGSDGVAVDGGSFVEWIETMPAQLFNPKIYRGYGPVRQPERIARVVADRAQIAVRLIEFDKILVVAPGKNHAIPRYHRIVVGVTKRRPVEIDKITLDVLREGSEYGDDNREYLTLDISAVPVDIETPITGYAFDAFNVAFETGRIRFEPAIDLASRMRTRFAEIVDYL